MKIENIKVVFTEYIYDKSNYAILIDGSWGSGKTFFWKNELSKIAIENQRVPIYLSLNGVAKITDLQYNLLVRLLSVVGDARKEKGKFLGAAADKVSSLISRTKGLLDILSKKFLGVKLDEVIAGVSIDFLDLSPFIICFDDLERCQIPINEVLGYLNNFVEHKGLKTVILADEKNISKQAINNEYDNIKEKLVGRVMKFEADLDFTIPSLIKIYSYDYQIFLESNIEYIIKLYKNFEVQNLRIINFYLSSLEKIFPFIKLLSPKETQSILLFAATICIEFKKGNLKSSDYADYKLLDSIHVQIAMKKYLDSKPDKNETTQQYFQKFYETYLEADDLTLKFYPSIYAFILTGYLDTNLLIEEIDKKSKAMSISETVFKNVFTHDFRNLADAEFSDSLEKSVEYLRSGAYNIYDYIQAADFLYYYLNNSVHSYKEEDIDSIIEEGLQNAKGKFPTDERTLENINHFPKENPKVIALVKHVNEIHDELRAVELRKDTTEFINALVSNDDESLQNVFSKYDMSTNLFPYIDSEELFQAILQISNGQLDKFNRQLHDRYRITNPSEFFSKDYSCLSELSDKVDVYYKETNSQPRKLLIGELAEELQKICSRIKPVE